MATTSRAMLPMKGTKASSRNHAHAAGLPAILSMMMKL
jgi:hypothetical protein